MTKDGITNYRAAARTIVDLLARDAIAPTIYLCCPGLECRCLSKLMNPPFGMGSQSTPIVTPSQMAFFRECKSLFWIESGINVRRLSAMGKMSFNILTTFAVFDADLIHLRTREGMAIAKARGRLKGKQPNLSDKQQKNWAGCTVQVSARSVI